MTELYYRVKFKRFPDKFLYVSHDELADMINNPKIKSDFVIVEVGSDTIYIVEV